MSSSTTEDKKRKTKASVRLAGTVTGEDMDTRAAIPLVRVLRDSSGKKHKKSKKEKAPRCSTPEPDEPHKQPPLVGAIEQLRDSMEARQSAFEESTCHRLALLERSRQEVPCPDFLKGFVERGLHVPVCSESAYSRLEEAAKNSKEDLVSDTSFMHHTYPISVPVLHFHLTGGLPG